MANRPQRRFRQLPGCRTDVRKAKPREAGHSKARPVITQMGDPHRRPLHGIGFHARLGRGGQVRPEAFLADLDASNDGRIHRGCSDPWDGLGVGRSSPVLAQDRAGRVLLREPASPRAVADRPGGPPATCGRRDLRADTAVKPGQGPARRRTPARRSAWGRAPKPWATASGPGLTRSSWARTLAVARAGMRDPSPRMAGCATVPRGGAGGW